MYTLPPYSFWYKHVMDMYEAYYQSRGCSTWPSEADRSRCIAEYERHNKEIRASVPRHQLLDYQVWQGWKPLCKFLNVSIPKVPFPKEATSESHVKAETQSMWARVRWYDSFASRADTRARNRRQKILSNRSLIGAHM